MLSDHQIRVISDRVIEECIRGIDDTKANRIPTALDISNAIDKIVLGSPTFTSAHQYSVDGEEIVDTTSSSKFNTNLYALIDDLTTLTNTIVSQIYSITKNFYASEYEMAKIGSRLRKLYEEVYGILLTSRNTNGILHTITNTLDDPDIYESMGIEISNGSAKLSADNTSIVDLSNLDITIRYDTDVKILSDTGIKSALDDIMDSYWMSIYTIDGKIESSRVSIDIPYVGSISEVIVEMLPGSGVTDVELRYIDGSVISMSDEEGRRVDSKISIGREYRSIADFIVVPQSVDGLSISISRVPDKVSDTTTLFSVGIKKITILSTDRERSGYIISNPTEFISSKNCFSANQLSIDVSELVPTGTRCDYYVGIDPWIAGYLTLDSNSLASTYDYSTSLAPDSYAFTSSTDYSGILGVRASELRRLGLSDYTSWEPSWIPITPVSRSSSSVGEDGTYRDKTVNLGAYTVLENASDYIACTEPIHSGGIDYYDIYEFDTLPEDITLMQGVSGYIQKTNDVERYRTVEVEAIMRVETTSGIGSDYYIDIGSYSDADGYVRALGSVVPGSITDIVWAGGNIDNPDHRILTEDKLPDFVSDVYISYDNGSATISKNTVSAWRFPDYRLRFKYTYEDTTNNYSVLETNIYVPDGAYPYITIVESDGVREVIVDTPDAEYISGDRYPNVQDNTTILLRKGWNRVRVHLKLGIKWDPTVNITIPDGLDYYAYYAPLEYMGSNTLYYNTHRHDHKKCGIRYDGTNYILFVNDPLAPLGTYIGDVYQNDGIIYWLPTGVIDDPSDIFGTAEAANAFYQLSYKLIGEYYTHVMLKCSMSGDGKMTPVLYEYNIRGGDKLVMEVDY